MSDDLYIIVPAAQRATAEALLARIDKVRDFPCCGCNVAEVPGCPCTQHTRPDGSPAPHVGSCTLRHSVLRVHPSDGRLAIRVDVVIRWLRTRDDLLAAKLTAAQITALKAAIDGAVALDSSWTPGAPA